MDPIKLVSVAALFLGFSFGVVAHKRAPYENQVPCLQRLHPESAKLNLVEITTTAERAIVTTNCRWHTPLEAQEGKRIKSITMQLTGQHWMPEKGRAMIIARYQNNALPVNDAQQYLERLKYAVTRMQDNAPFESDSVFEVAGACNQGADISWQLHFLVRRPRAQMEQSVLQLGSVNMQVAYEGCWVEDEDTGE